MGLQLTEKEILYLERKGFKKKEGKYSEYYFLEQENDDIVLIPKEDNRYELENYQLLDDGEGNYYIDMQSTYSAKNITLEQFIEQEIG